MNLPIIQTITPAAPPLPMHPEDVIARGWDSVDIVFITGDAYVDYPSFANGLLARLLESEGFRIAVLAQPNWQNCHDWRQFGRPNLFFAISAGNMDSMINHYTANRKVRNDDAYSPGGEIGLRPDRATLAYCQRSREANQSFSEQKSGDHIRGLNKTKKKQRARVSRSPKTVGYRPKRSGNG